MDTYKELMKLERKSAELGIKLTDLAKAAGQHKYYFYNAKSRHKRHPETQLRGPVIMRLQAALAKELKKRDEAALRVFKEPEQNQAAPVNYDNLTPAQMVDLIHSRCKASGITLSTVSRKVGYGGGYLSKITQRVTDPKWKFRRTPKTLRKILEVLDQMQKPTHPTFQEPLVNLKAEEQVQEQLKFDDELVVAPATPTAPAPVVIPVVGTTAPQQSARDIIKGMIMDRIDKLSFIELSLLLAHVSKEKAQ